MATSIRFSSTRGISSDNRLISESTMTLAEMAGRLLGIKGADQSLAREKLEYLRDARGIRSIPERELRTFDVAYYVRNLVKCATALEVMDIHLPTTANYKFIDIGSGLGAFSHALANRFQRANNSYTLLDRSGSQMVRASEFTRRLHLRGQFKFVRGDLARESSKDFWGSIVLSSYCLCEFMREDGDLGKVFEGAAALVVDYPWLTARLSEMARVRGWSAIERRTALEVPQRIQDLIGQEVVEAAYVVINSDRTGRCLL